MKNTKICNIINFLKSIDLFGVIYTPSLFSKEEHKTIYGSILTIILIIFVILKIEIVLNNIITNENYKVIDEKDILNDEN